MASRNTARACVGLYTVVSDINCILFTVVLERFRVDIRNNHQFNQLDIACFLTRCPQRVR